MPDIDGSLLSWDEIEENYQSILIGNGASIAASSRFSYASLKEEAELSPELEDVFAHYDNTVNFEEILSKLATAADILEMLPDTSDESKEVVVQNYQELQNSLFQAMSSIHPEKSAWYENNEIEKEVRQYLKSLRAIYTTNYDLILYWTLLLVSAARGFKDYFFNNLTFDISNTSASGITICYLHGALHLYSDPSLTTKKIPNAAAFDGGITQIQEALSNIPNAFPLIVTEGSWKKKLNTIKKYDYLDFCLDKLKKDTNSFVIFGHSLSKDYDLHIVNALNIEGKRLAISIYRGQKTEDQIRTEKASYIEVLNNVGSDHITFFNSSTHPLGNSERTL